MPLDDEAFAELKDLIARDTDTRDLVEPRQLPTWKKVAGVGAALALAAGAFVYFKRKGRKRR